jgi:hypothetical protein
MDGSTERIRRGGRMAKHRFETATRNELERTYALAQPLA